MHQLMRDTNNETLIRKRIRGSIQRAIQESAAAVFVLIAFVALLAYSEVGSPRFYGCLIILVGTGFIAGVVWSYALSYPMLRSDASITCTKRLWLLARGIPRSSQVAEAAAVVVLGSNLRRRYPLCLTNVACGIVTWSVQRDRSGRLSQLRFTRPPGMIAASGGLSIQVFQGHCATTQEFKLCGTALI